MPSISNNPVPQFPSSSSSLLNGRTDSFPSHQCSCSEGYQLSSDDKFSCIALDHDQHDVFLDHQGALLLAAGSKLEALNLDASYFQIIYSHAPYSGSKFSSSSSSSKHNLNRPMSPDASAATEYLQHSKHIAGYLSRSSPLAVHVQKKLAFVVDESGSKILGYQIDGKSHCSIEVGTRIGWYTKQFSQIFRLSG